MNSIQSLVKVVEELQQKVTKLEAENSEIKAKLNSVNEIADTRSENFPPSYYRRKGVGIYREFKHIDIYPEIKDNSIWLYVETIVQWGDTTGGGIRQIIYSENNMYYRVGKFDDTEWKQLCMMNKLKLY